MLKKSKFELLNSKGFTLIELIIVMAIIALIASLLIVSMNIARARGRDTRRIADVESISNALEMYATTNDDLPTLGLWSDLVTALDVYIKGEDFPEDPKEADGFHYVVCVKNMNYMVATALERPRAIKDDIDAVDTDPLVAEYNYSSECIISGGILSSLDCSDTAGNIAGYPVTTGESTVVCMGYYGDQ